MAKRGTVQTDLTAEEFHERYRQSKDAVERTHWHMLWLLKEGKSPREVAELLGYTASPTGSETVRCGNTHKPEVSQLTLPTPLLYSLAGHRFYSSH
jgi:hypothetical protein